MRIFQTIQKDFEFFGVGLTQPKFNTRNWFTLFIFILNIASNTVYIVCEANTFQEYNQSIYMISSLLCATAVFSIEIVTMHTLYGCLNDMEQLIEGSKLIILTFSLIIHGHDFMLATKFENRQTF